MVNMYKLRLTNLQQEILRLLFVKAGTSLNHNGIARFLEVSPPAVRKALPRLEKENLIRITQDKISRRWAVELNRENYRVMQLKRADNFRQIYESGLADFLFNEFPGCTAVIFGSYSLGEDVFFGENDERNSDIDIAIIGTTGKELDLKEYNKLLERNVSVNFYKSWQEIHKQLKESILKGITLSGGIEL